MAQIARWPTSKALQLPRARLFRLARRFTSRSGVLRPHLAPTALRHAVARKDAAPSTGIARFTLKLGTRAALLLGLMRGICAGINFGCISYEAQGDGGGIIGI